jgi:glycosyl transferase family 87
MSLERSVAISHHEPEQKNRTIFLFGMLVPIFLILSLLIAKINDAHTKDFAAYWQAGHMLLSGQNVYDSPTWIAERELLRTALHSEPTFQYPLPFAILFAPFALLSVQSSYTFWIFLAQVAILASIVILLRFYPARSGYVELAIVAGIFSFRSAFSVIVGGQILPFLLFFVSVSIFLFDRKKWFWGGFLLSLLSVKPSIGIPILALAGVWLLSRKQWMGILGMLVGGIALFLIGALVNPYWVVDYVNIGGDSFSKYFGMHPTLWGVVDKILVVDSRSIVAGMIVALTVFLLEAYFFHNAQAGPLEAFASILPAGLLMAPYSWAYDQILLTVPIVYLAMNISASQGSKVAVLFLFGVVALAVVLVFIAYLVEHDVWSVVTPITLWVLVRYFITRNARLENS